MKEFISDFNRWASIFENESEYTDDQAIASIRHLVELGVLDVSELRAFLREKGADTIINQPHIKEILNLPEYKELQSHGLELVSSKTQLLNGTIVFGYPGYIPANQFAIGIFPGSKVIRRLTPKGIPLGVWSRHIGSMDIRIKELLAVQDDQLYRVAMRWILDHIDFEKINQNTKTPYFPVKNKTRKGYFGRD